MYSNYIINSYLKIYTGLFPLGNILSKDYNTTLIRNMMIYFLYKHYKKNEITRVEIQDFFKIKHINSIHNKINIVSMNLDNPNFLLKKKEIFMHFFYKFQKVYANKNLSFMKYLTPNEVNENFDIKIDIIDLENGTFLVKDNIHKIEFICSPGVLDYSIKNDKSFNDEYFFLRVKAQNNDSEIFDKNDSFYNKCLLQELDRIFLHISNFDIFKEQ